MVYTLTSIVTHAHTHANPAYSHRFFKEMHVRQKVEGWMK